jgi:hypothetical protein
MRTRNRGCGGSDVIVQASLKPRQAEIGGCLDPALFGSCAERFLGHSGPAYRISPDKLGKLISLSRVCKAGEDLAPARIGTVQHTMTGSMQCRPRRREDVEQHWTSKLGFE